MTTTTGWTERWILLYKSFGKIPTKVFIRSVRVLYVVYSSTKVVLTLIKLLIDSLTVSPFIATKKFYEELDINNVCVLIYIFRWYVQCLAKKLTMNLIEFSRLKVWRSFDSLAVKIYWRTGQQRHRPRVCKIQPLSFQNFFSVSPIFGRETRLNESHRKFDDYLILQPRSQGPLSSYLEKVPWLRLVTIKSKTHPRCGFDLYTWTRDQPQPGYFLEVGRESTLGTRLFILKAVLCTMYLCRPFQLVKVFNAQYFLKRFEQYVIVFLLLPSTFSLRLLNCYP